MKLQTLSKCLKNQAVCKVNPESGHRECICNPGLVGDGRIKCERELILSRQMTSQRRRTDIDATYCYVDASTMSFQQIP